MIKLLPVEDNFMSQFHSSPSSSSAAAGGGGGGAGGVKRGPIAKEDFERIFKHYDQDNSGKVEGEEIGESWARIGFSRFLGGWWTFKKV